MKVGKLAVGDVLWVRDKNGIYHKHVVTEKYIELRNKIRMYRGPVLLGIVLTPVILGIFYFAILMAAAIGN